MKAGLLHGHPGRVVIDRLDLDLRGIDRRVAEAALPLIGAALQGRLPATPGPAAALAQRIAAGLVAAAVRTEPVEVRGRASFDGLRTVGNTSSARTGDGTSRPAKASSKD
jgi:hypothetical protein